MTIDVIFTDAVTHTRSDPNALHIGDKCTKLGEEFGEFCQSVLIARGKIANRPHAGTPMEEGADIMLMVVDILSELYDVPPRQLIDMLDYQTAEKLKKWKTL